MAFMKPRTLTTDEIAALKTFAAIHGRNAESIKAGANTVTVKDSLAGGTSRAASDRNRL